MRNWKPIDPPRDIDPRVYEILKRLNQFVVQSQSGFAKLDRGTTTDGSSSALGVTDHGQLTGLVPTSADANDDHTQYLLLSGRSGGQSVLGDPGTSSTGTTPTLILANFNLNSVTGAQRISLIGGGSGSGSIKVETNQFNVFERTSTDGFRVFTGANFANVQNTGKLALTGAASSNPVLLVNHSSSGLTNDTVVVRAANGQSGDLTRWETSVSTRLSYIRSSDGAFVGPVVASGTDTHIDSAFRIIGSADATKQVAFEVDGLTTATTRTVTVPDLAAGTMVVSSGLLTNGRVPYVNGGLLQDVSTLTFNVGTGVLTAPNFSFSSLTAGRVPFVTTGSVLADSGVFTWDNVNNRLAVGSTTPQSGFHLGAGGTHTGGGIYDALLEGRVYIGDGLSGVNFTTGRALHIQHSMGTTTGVTFARINPTLGNISTYTGTFIGLDIQATGIPGGSSGSYTFNNLRILNSAQLAASGATCSDAVGFTLQSTPVESPGTITNYTGGDLNVQGTAAPKSVTDTGVSTNGTTSLTVTTTTGLSAGMWISPGTSTTIPVQTTIVSIDTATTLTMSNSATGTEGPVTVVFQPFGTDLRLIRCRLSARQHAMTNVVGFKFESPAVTTGMVKNVAYFWSNQLIADTTQTTNWSFIKHDITAVNSTNVWALDFTSTNPNRIAGKVTIGATTAPAEYLDLYGNLKFPSGGNLITDTTTGTKIATNTAQKLGFWNAAPIVQPTVAVAAATKVGGGGVNVTDTDTFDGYTIAQVVKALRNTGLLA